MVASILLYNKLWINPHCRLIATVLHLNNVNVFWIQVQCYDPVGNRWNIAAECPQPWRYTAAAVLGSQIFIMGGDTEFTAASAYRFDCETNQWTRVGDMTSKRMSCHAVASGNKLYVVGGYFGTQRCKTLDCYDPTSDSWNSITTVPYSLIPTAFVSTWKHLPA